jgi:tetratricopeptide (TPR) repeat protein
MIPKGNYYANWAPNYTHLPWGQLSICLWYQGKIKKSKECLLKALEYDPENEIYQANLYFYPKEIK